ncbi:MAG: HlyD family efflux transporter periplasmic adaptor subunit [Candidatus Kapabacteria bacterium]|nr:HlyD family efflux transporter periplasmic adaptor subunit [Candidatus Kapabacteria bacterium]
MDGFEGLHERQYKALYDDDDSYIGTHQSIALRVVIALCATLVLLGVIAASVLRIPRQFTSPFVFKNDAKELSLRFAGAISIDTLFVKPGMKVQKGQPLITITSPEIVALITEYTIAKNNELLFEQTDVPLRLNQKSTLALEKKKYQAQIADAQKERVYKEAAKKSELKRLETELAAAVKNLDELKKLKKKGYAAEMELRDADVKRSKAQDALTRIRDQYNRDMSQIETRVQQLDVDRTITNTNSTKVELELSGKRTQLRAATQTAYAKLRNMYGDFTIDGSSLVILSPDALTVTTVYDNDRQAESGTMLVKLTSGLSGLYASASSTPQHIGSLRNGQEVVLKVSAFPHYNYGVVKATVSNLSTSPNDEGNYPFEARITDAGQLRPLLQSGMNGELSILIEEYTLFEYLRRSFQHSLQ